MESFLVVLLNPIGWLLVNPLGATIFIMWHVCERKREKKIPIWEDAKPGCFYKTYFSFLKSLWVSLKASLIVSAGSGQLNRKAVWYCRSLQIAEMLAHRSDTRTTDKGWCLCSSQFYTHTQTHTHTHLHTHTHTDKLHTAHPTTGSLKIEN